MNLKSESGINFTVECKSKCMKCKNRLKRIVGDALNSCLSISGVHSVMIKGKYHHSAFYCSNWVKDKNAYKKRS